MLTELCNELRNWWEMKRFSGDFTITDGGIDLTETGIADGQHFRIIGSVFNDGVHKYPATDLDDEVFNGVVCLLAIPKEVIDLAESIDEWRGKYENVTSANMSPFTSESLGGYSYSKGSGAGSGSGGSGSTWQSVFASALNRWRKIR